MTHLKRLPNLTWPILLAASACLVVGIKSVAHAATVTYQLTINNDWSAATHPANFPGDAHFSWLGGGTHNSNVSFWTVGEMASPGMVQMAETGNVDILVNTEVQAAIDAGNAFSGIYEKKYTPEILPGPGSRTTTFQIRDQFPLVTLVTMLGPSPDWFVGVSGLALYENNAWIDQLDVNLALYDGGTRSDITPHMGGTLSDPVQPISLITYDNSTGNYIATNTPHYVGSFSFQKVTPTPLPPAIGLFGAGFLALVGFITRYHRRHSYS